MNMEIIMKKEEQINYYTYKLNMPILNILAILLLLLISSIVFLMEYQDSYTIHFKTSILFILMFVWLIIHEILHGIGFSLFKCVKKANITFGMFLEKGVFYCMCKQNIPKKVILTSLLFPITIIGIITLIIGMIFNQYELVLLSILNIVSSIGDIVMTIYFLKAPKDIIYLDLDDVTSFTVISSKPLENIKVPGIMLEKKGTYDKNKMFAKDKRKLVISKASYILIGVIFLLIIMNIVGD